MKRFLYLALAFCIGAAAAFAQTLAPTSLTGNEAWSCAIGGPQGPSQFCTANLMRNTAGYQTSSATTATQVGVVSAVRYIYTAAVTSISLTAPASPLDGEMLEIVNGTGSNFVGYSNLIAAAGQTVNSGAVGNLSANTSAEWQYANSTTTWYRLR